MKVTVIMAAAALAFGGAAFAQQHSTHPQRGEVSERVEQQDHGQASDKMRHRAERAVDRTKGAMHRGADRVRQFARGDKRQDHGDRHHARSDHHDRRASDTRTMGAPGRDVDHDRRARMDSAYENWRARQQR